MRSQLDYTVFNYIYARMSYLKQLDPTRYEGLRQVWGPIRTSPVDRPMKYHYNSDVKNWLCNTTQNSNIAI